MTHRPLSDQPTARDLHRIDLPEAAVDRTPLVGGRHGKVDALDLMTGMAKYTDDLVLPRMLHAKILRSPHAHARILAIDTSRAEAMTGVHAVVVGSEMPVKYGVTLAELFAALGLEWRQLELEAVQERLDLHGLALTHQPRHFPAANHLVRVREEIGKRPPVASLELLWTPHQGDHLLVSGFVHPPTETRAWEALAAAGETDLLTVKGLEGSTDLPTTRAGITARVRHGTVERLILHPRDHGIETEEVAWHSLDHWRSAALQALQGEGELAPALRWNLGAYLWFAGQISDLPAALAQAEALMATRVGLAQLERLQ